MDKTKGKKTGAAKKPTTKKTAVPKKENSILTTAKEVVTSVANAIPTLGEKTMPKKKPVTKKKTLAKKTTTKKPVTPKKTVTTTSTKKTSVKKTPATKKKTTTKDFSTRKLDQKTPVIETQATPVVENKKVEKKAKKEKKSEVKQEKKKEETKTSDKGIVSLTKFLSGVKAKHLEDVLVDLMTEKEIKEFAERIEILKLLSKKTPQREIAKKLGISVTTVSRGSKVLQSGKGKIQKYL